MSYKVLSQIRANGTLYTSGESFPEKLPKVNYEELLAKGLLEQLETKAPVSQPKVETKTEPKKINQNIKSEK
jgi:hypothetical protein